MPCVLDGGCPDVASSTVSTIVTSSTPVLSGKSHERWWCNVIQRYQQLSGISLQAPVLKLHHLLHILLLSALPPALML